MKSLDFTVEFNLHLSHECLEEIIDMAGYGIGYWASEAEVNNEVYIVTEGVSEEKFTLTSLDIAKGVELYIKNGNRPYNIIKSNNAINSIEIDSETIDSEVADMIIQYACFGEIVYG